MDMGEVIGYSFYSPDLLGADYVGTQITPVIDLNTQVAPNFFDVERGLFVGNFTTRIHPDTPDSLSCYRSLPRALQSGALLL